MDATRALKDAENALRDLIAQTLERALGNGWESDCGVTEERLTKWRECKQIEASRQETGESYFPRIESARDNSENIYTAGTPKLVITGKRLRPGDSLDFVITAIDPLEAELHYSFGFLPSTQWQQNNSGTVTVSINHVGLGKNVYLNIMSPREFHAHDNYDDCVVFSYDVLPPLG